MTYGSYMRCSNSLIDITWGIIFLLMNEPWTPIFALSSFNILNVLIPGLEHEKRKLYYLPILFRSPVYEKGIVQDMVVVVKRAHLVALNEERFSGC